MVWIIVKDHYVYTRSFLETRDRKEPGKSIGLCLSSLQYTFLIRHTTRRSRPETSPSLVTSLEAMFQQMDYRIMLRELNRSGVRGIDLSPSLLRLINRNISTYFLVS